PDLPGHQQQRKVPGADDADYAARHANTAVKGVSAVGGVQGKGFSGNVADQISKHLEVGGAAWNVYMGGKNIRLAGVFNLGIKKVFEAALDAVDQRVQ